MKKSIEIIIKESEIIADFGDIKIDFGFPKDLIFRINEDGNFKLSDGKKRRFKIIYSQNISESVEQDLHLLSAYLEAEAEITTSEPLYRPNNRNMFQIELPQNVLISINYSPS
ncbi:hypothetical protein HY212_03525 [Candidatus Pacearchaeota archaeon]|nr:hypothetical protein [Candidatus Pacearchaeota archaeon]